MVNHRVTSRVSGVPLRATNAVDGTGATGAGRVGSTGIRATGSGTDAVGVDSTGGAAGSTGRAGGLATGGAGTAVGPDWSAEVGVGAVVRIELGQAHERQSRDGGQEPAGQARLGHGEAAPPRTGGRPRTSKDIG